LARWAAPDVLTWHYAVIMSIWSYPILAIMVLGTWRHQQRVARSGDDPSWSGLAGRSAKRRRGRPNG
jgi:hypothetical protein